jgi:DNA-binding NtrC family response regulator
VGALASRPWPGNVRELDNAIARLLALAEPGDELDVDAVSRLEGPDATPGAAPSGKLRDQVAAFESALVARTLRATGHNQSEAARRLGVSRMTLIEKMKRHGIR